jgi:hypothetical protein
MQEYPLFQFDKRIHFVGYRPHRIGNLVYLGLNEP